jgi:hypothetical protein
VTKEGLEALEEYAKLHGKAAVEAVPLSDVSVELAESIEDAAWRERKRRRRRESRRQGRHLLTVCGRWRAGKRIPDIRLCGLWLKRAGFDLGQELEVDVEAGAMTIRAV